MRGQSSIDINLSQFYDNAVVCDIVYVPLETDLLRSANNGGLRTSSGLGMLLLQAAPGFQHWFEVRPEVTVELRSLIETDIERGA
jgi:shikimate dehydrogenase